MGQYAIGAGQYGVGGLWVAVTATAIAPVDPYTEIRVNTVKSKSFAATAGQLDLATNNQVALVSPDGSDYIVQKNGGQYFTDNSTLRFSVEDAAVSVQNINVNWYAAVTQTDLRHQWSSGGYIRSTPSAGGNINDVGLYERFPIENGQVVAAGDIVRWSTNLSNRVRSAIAGTVTPIAGYCTVGGTGDVNGTVLATILVRGYVAQTFVAGTGGVTAHQYAQPDNAVANQVDAAAAPVASSFALILLTAIATALTDLYILGTRT